VARQCLNEEVHIVLDVLFVVLTVGFFALAVAYVRFCERV
jgi:hypothetical protein